MSSNLGAVLMLVALVAFLAYTGIRFGLQFLVRRVAGLIFVLLGVTFVTFIMGYFAPGDAAIGQLGVHYTPQAAAQLRHFYGLDLPWYQQYGNFLNHLLRLDLGTSFISRDQTVWEILQRGVPISCEVGISALILTLLIGIPLGMIAAVKQNTHTDTVIQSIALTLYALPSFVIIAFFDILMIKMEELNIPHLPVAGWDLTQPQTLVAPIVIDALIGFAYFTRLTRTSMLEVMREDYIRAARAKGVNDRLVITRHVFRNAVLPLITAIGPSIAFLVNGAFLIELFFNIPGIGFQTVSSIEARDWPVLQGTVIILAAAVVLMNLVTDMFYGFADPRIKVV